MPKTSALKRVLSVMISKENTNCMEKPSDLGSLRQNPASVLPQPVPLLPLPVLRPWAPAPAPWASALAWPRPGIMTAADIKNPSSKVLDGWS